jgi:hypothetical protein
MSGSPLFLCLFDHFAQQSGHPRPKIRGAFHLGFSASNFPR